MLLDKRRKAKTCGRRTDDSETDNKLSQINTLPFQSFMKSVKAYYPRRDISRLDHFERETSYSLSGTIRCSPLSRRILGVDNFFAEDKVCYAEMTDDEVFLVHHGYWDEMEYKNGKENLVYASLRIMSLEEFMDVVHYIVRIDRRCCEYVLHCLMEETEGCGITKFQIRSEKDMQRVAEVFPTPKIYVSIKAKPNRTPSEYASLSLGRGSFAQRMASQDQNCSPNLYTYNGYMHNDQIEAECPPISVNA